MTSNFVESNNQFELESIALSFSGGGFRAASFTLGCTSYLNQVYYQGKPLLHKVKFISSASGGSITNLVLSSMLRRGKDFYEIYNHLICIMSGFYLLEEVFSILGNEECWKDRPDKSMNLINSFALAYDKIIFNKEQFGIFFESPAHNKFYIEEICINTTEFDNGLNFRFGNNVNSLQTRIGNQYLYLKKNNPFLANVKKIKLADILASSSCFPAGFEPIMFPRDFAWSDSENSLSVKDLNATITQINKYNEQESEASKANKEITVGFMDGGIDDNQGIYAFILADSRKKVYNYDLYMACDVTSNYLSESFKYPSIETYKNLNLTAKSLFYKYSKRYFIPLIAVFVVAIVLLVFQKFNMLASILLGISFASIVLPILGCFLVKKFIFSLVSDNKSQNTWMIVLNKYKNKLLSLQLNTLITMTLARLKSVLLLADTVYLKKIRRSSYTMLFDKKSIDVYKDKIREHNASPSLDAIAVNSLWNNHVSMTALHLLSTKNDFQLQSDLAKESWIKSAKNPNTNVDLLEPFLQPSIALRAIVDVAVEIDTTLWFDENHIKKEALKCLIISGQATTCFNLLRVVNRFENNQQEWLTLKKQLFNDWQKFKVTPDWMYKDVI